MNAAARHRFAAVVCGAVLALGCGSGKTDQGTSTEPPTRVETDPALLTIGRPVDLEPFPVPDVSTTTVDGLPFEMKALQGRVVVVNFWATYCAPCVKEMPLLVDTYAQQRDSGLVVLGVSMDLADNPGIRPFLDRFQVDYPVIVEDGGLSEAFGGVYVLPTTFFVDRSGRVVSRINGLIREPVLTRMLAEML